MSQLSATEAVFVRNFRKALYYAVREDFNAQDEPKFTERNPKLDALIRWGIAMIEQRNRLPEMAPIEVEALAHCAHRRGIHPMQRKQRRFKRLNR